MNTLLLLTGDFDMVMDLLEQLRELLDSLSSSSGNIADIATSAAAIASIVFAVVGAIVSAVGATVAFIIAVVTAVVSFIVSLIKYLIKSIPLFIFARKAGHKYAWFAFIPLVRTYLMGTLPQREFNIFKLIKTNKRGLVTLIYLLVKVFFARIMEILVIIPVVGEFSALIRILLMASFKIVEWRLMYDMLLTARKDDIAMPISIIGAFFPIVYDVVFLFNCKSEPDYGAGNFPEHSKEYAF